MIYIDSNILIYAIEDRSGRGDHVRTALAAVQVPVAASPLVLHECLVVPLRQQNLELRDQYLAAYEQLEQLDLDIDVFMRAAELRADFGIRTPDALHLAAAQLAKCEALWTNDHRLVSASRGLAVNMAGGDSGR